MERGSPRRRDWALATKSNELMFNATLIEKISRAPACFFEALGTSHYSTTVLRHLHLTIQVHETYIKSSDDRCGGTKKKVTKPEIDNDGTNT